MKRWECQSVIAQACMHRCASVQMTDESTCASVSKRDKEALSIKLLCSYE